ncbi:MAG: WD40/YVTN/BNR-like repeat-containing protein, partial [Gemmatimonas sp.]|uniref:WD40/YVTN/BNR-like repeat-containing protein n=1 Tax=Gemmatimonas sp. TaxID=1962908 RepID=UPI00391BFE2A
AKYRMQWTFPIFVSPHDPKTIYVGSNVLFKTTNEGDSYTAISPDLSRNDPRTLGPSGGPITKDQTGVETFGTVFAVAESPVLKGTIWAGTDDGLVHLTRNGGATWTNVTPPLLKEREWARVSIIEASHSNAGTAYVAANRFQMDDQEPYLFKTTDFGRTWTRIDAGIPRTEFTRVIREDDTRPGLLFAGTERGIWASLDDGATWFSLKRNLPIVPVHDLAIKEGDLIAGTHGRSFYVIDDIGVLRQLSAEVIAKRAHLFTPRPSYRINWGGGFQIGQSSSPVGQNPPNGAIVYYWLKDKANKVTIEFRDSTGRTVRSFSSDEAAPTAGGGGRRAVAGDRPPTNAAGMNTFSWNLREGDATTFPGMILWAGVTTGPLVLPGTYTVRLLVDGAPAGDAKLLVKKDPRSEATPLDLVAQYKLLMAIRDRTTDANDAVRTVRHVRNQAKARMTQVGADSAKYAQLVKQLDTKISAMEAEIYQVKNQSGQDPLNFPIKVNNQIAALAGVVGSTEARPTKQSQQVFDLLTKELEGYLVELRKTYQELIPPIDELLKKHGHPAIEVKPADTPQARQTSAEEEVTGTRW